MKNIVVIDDSPTIRTSVQFALKKLGHTIKQAENGVKGLEVVDELISAGEDISLCVVDINMPEMDGISFVKHFRDKDKFTPILVLTTESEEKKMREGKEAGASGWMVKPFKPNDLIDVVQKLIR